MGLSREEIEQLARASAQTVLEGLHRYAVDYVPPATIAQGLRDSMIEEATAGAWYRRRAESAKGDPATAALYEHVASEEDNHYQTFKARLREVDTEPAPSNGHHEGPEESGSLYQPPDPRAKKCDFPWCDKWARYYGKEAGVTRYLCTPHFKEVYKVPNW